MSVDRHSIQMCWHAKPSMNVCIWALGGAGTACDRVSGVTQLLCRSDGFASASFTLSPAVLPSCRYTVLSAHHQQVDGHTSKTSVIYHHYNCRPNGYGYSVRLRLVLQMGNHWTSRSLNQGYNFDDHGFGFVAIILPTRRAGPNQGLTCGV